MRFLIAALLLVAAPAYAQVYNLHVPNQPYDGSMTLTVPPPPAGVTTARVSVRHQSLFRVGFENPLPVAQADSWLMLGRWSLSSDGRALARGRSVARFEHRFAPYDGVMDFHGPSGAQFRSLEGSWADAYYPAEMLASGALIFDANALVVGSVVGNDYVAQFVSTFEADIRIEYLP